MRIIEIKPQFPLLSWKEWEALLPLLSAEILGARVLRVFVPGSPTHPEGHQKRTVILELSRGTPKQLLLSLRSQECGLFLLPEKSLRPEPKAPRSGFELSLEKLLPGLVVDRIEQIPFDRVLLIGFQNSSRALSLELRMIPGRPAGILSDGATGEWLSGTLPKESFPPTPPRTDTQKEVPFRRDWVTSVSGSSERFLSAEREQHLKLRHSALSRIVQAEIQTVEGRIRSLIEQEKSSLAEPDWARFGMLLKSNFHLAPRLRDGFYELSDPSTGDPLRIPGNPKLTPEAQLEKFFHLAKRKKKRIEESRERIESLEKKLTTLESRESGLTDAVNEADLKKLEREIIPSKATGAPLPSRDLKKLSGFTGRQYVSKEGLTILSGRNLTENLELTFKIARGNDLWLHVKGRPGSHTVILLPGNRSASLDTLLDAAHLCILHSGGKEWGKTEVDYTSRKYVKKIKNQTEVSYSGNKTLSITLDPARLKRITDALS